MAGEAEPGAAGRRIGHPDIRAAVLRCVGFSVVHLAGTLAVRTAPAVRAVLREVLAWDGFVLVEVSRLQLGWVSSVAVFPGVHAIAGGWPDARLLLCAATPAMAAALTACGIDRTVPVCLDLTAAWAAREQRPDVVTRRTDLERDPVAARNTAARFVRRVCEDWGMAVVAGPATRLADLLVTSTVDDDPQIRRQLIVSRHADTARITITAPVPPTPAVLSHLAWASAPVPALPAGHLAIAAASERWGVIEHPDPGGCTAIWTTAGGAAVRAATIGTRSARPLDRLQRRHRSQRQPGTARRRRRPARQRDHRS